MKKLIYILLRSFKSYTFYTTKKTANSAFSDEFAAKF
jgi:hypothetical protein